MKRTWLLFLVWLVCLTLPAQIESELACRRFTTQDGLPQMQTEIVWQDSYGYIYIGTLSGFVRYDGRTFTPFLKGKRENIIGFTETAGGVRALGFLRQWLIDGDQVTMCPVDPEGKCFINNFNAGDLPDGYVLTEDVNEQNRHLCKVTADGFHPILKGKLLDEMTPDRHLYIDSLTGLHIPRGDIFAYRRLGQTLYAFGANGIYTVQGRTLTMKTRFHFEAPDYGLFVRQMGTTIAIADAHSLYFYDGHQVRKVADGFNLIKCLFVDRWQRLWLATYEGLYCFFNCDFTNHRLSDPNDIVRGIGVGRDNQLVMGSLNGKLIADGHILLDNPDNFYAPSAVTIGGQVYMAGNGDVVCIDGQTTTWLNLPKDYYQFVAQANGKLIAGSRKQVVCYDPKTRQSDTLTTQIIHPWCAADDRQGNLWIGSTYGLFRISGQKTEKLTKLIISAMERTPQGDVIFASSDSLFILRNGEMATLNDQIPALAGHEIRTLHLSPRGTLTIACIDGFFAARISDDYRLSDIHFFDHRNGFTLIEPLKASIAETADGTLWLAGIEGMTSFRPEALLARSQEETFIHPPLRWYEHWWVWCTGILILGLIIWWFALWFARRHTEKKMRQLQRAKKEKELQISAIRLKAIPHFHSNVLAAIEYFVMNNSTEEATKYLKLYSDFTNETLQNIDKPARTVEEETEYIRKYLELEQLRYGERLSYNINIDDHVNRQALLPTMLLHTYCQNAIKHGLSHKPEGGTVSISITARDQQTIVTVEDTGIGRKAARNYNTDSTKQGLRILHEQIQLYNKSNIRHIKEHVVDLKDAEGRAAGSRYQLIIPEEFNFI